MRGSIAGARVLSVMSASMVAMRGRLQKEGEVIHIICDRIIDHDAMLRSIAHGDVSITPGRGDGARSGGGPDSRDAPLRVRSHDFTKESRRGGRM